MPSRPMAAVCLVLSLLAGWLRRAPARRSRRGAARSRTGSRTSGAPRRPVRRQAVLKLGNVGDADPAAAEALAGALRDPDALVRHDAVLGVLKLAKPAESIVATLETMARGDADARVREVAAKALAKLGRGD